MIPQHLTLLPLLILSCLTLGYLLALVQVSQYSCLYSPVPLDFYWKFVFDDQQYCPQEVVASAICLIHKINYDINSRHINILQQSALSHLILYVLSLSFFYNLLTKNACLCIEPMKTSFTKKNANFFFKFRPVFSIESWSTVICFYFFYILFDRAWVIMVFWNAVCSIKSVNKISSLNVIHF